MLHYVANAIATATKQKNVAQSLNHTITCHGCHNNHVVAIRFDLYCYNYLALQKLKFLVVELAFIFEKCGFVFKN
jgi:hypothetical protein